MKHSPEFLGKLSQFCRKATDDTLYGPGQYGRGQYSYDPHNGIKFVRIVVSDDGQHCSSRYFVRVSDGAIFACESWKKPNLRRQYGTLDTIDQFDWSGYQGMAKPDSEFVMKATDGHYFTAVPICDS